MNVDETAKPTKPVKSREEEERMWAMILHLSQFAYFVVPVVGVVAPIVIWQIKKDEYESLDIHGRIVTNWLITAFAACCVFVPLSFIIVGIPLLIGLTIAHVAFASIGAIKAHSGEVWPYPCTLIKVF